MRATSVVFSSLAFVLSFGASAVAGADDKASEKKAPATTAAKGQPAATPGSPASPAAAPAVTGDTTPAASPSPDVATVRPEDMPTAVRMRRLEQKTQALKERAWQLKARVQMLKEQMLGGGAGAQAVVAHNNEMGASFRLIKLIYSLDGTQVFVRTDDSGENLYKSKGFDVFAGPISPGNHNVAAVATYRGHGYGVFEYLSKYTFTARGNQAFLAGEGKIAKVDCKGFEKGGPTTPLEKRAAIECKVTQVQPEKPPESTAPKPGPVPSSTAAPVAPGPASVTPPPAAAPVK
jgi:hypothetical protein